MADYEETIAIVYLHLAEDQDNKCMLTSERLMVVYKGKLDSYDRTHIRDLYFNKRRLLLPLVSGGIAAPLSLLAIFLNLYNPWPLMFVFFLGLALFYLGLQQHPVLTIKDTVKEHDYFLQEVTPNLKAFLSFARQVIFRGESLLFLALPLDQWQEIQGAEVIQPFELKQQGFIRLMNQQQLKRWKLQKKEAPGGWAVLHIDPTRVQADIRYEAAPGTRELFAHLYGSLRKENVLRQEFM